MRIVRYKGPPRGPPEASGYALGIHRAEEADRDVEGQRAGRDEDQEEKIL